MKIRENKMFNLYSQRYPDIGNIFQMDTVINKWINNIVI